MDEVVYCERNWYFAHKDDTLTVEVKRGFGDDVTVTVKEMGAMLSGTAEQIRALAESFSAAVQKAIGDSGREAR